METQRAVRSSHSFIKDFFCTHLTLTCRPVKPSLLHPSANQLQFLCVFLQHIFMLICVQTLSRHCFSSLLHVELQIMLAWRSNGVLLNSRLNLLLCQPKQYFPSSQWLWNPLCLKRCVISWLVWSTVRPLSHITRTAPWLVWKRTETTCPLSFPTSCLLCTWV